MPPCQIKLCVSLFYTTLLGKVSFFFLTYICIVRSQHIMAALFIDTWIWSNIFEWVVWQCDSGQSYTLPKTSPNRPVRSDLYFLLFRNKQPQSRESLHNVCLCGNTLSSFLYYMEYLTNTYLSVSLLSYCYSHKSIFIWIGQKNWYCSLWKCVL